MSQVKERVRKRENNKCFFCNTKKNLTFAHIFVWNRDGGKVVEENGVCICRECHDKMDFQKGCTELEQLRMQRQCYAYLTFMYCDYGKQEEIPLQKIKGNKRR